MTVARSAALAVAACSAMTSSLTSAPLARSASSASPGSICHTCDRAGTRSRKLPIFSPNAAVSAKRARAPESDRIHSACSANEVS